MLEHGIVIDDPNVFNDKLQDGEDFYNFHRPHGGLDRKTPYERLRQKTTNPTRDRPTPVVLLTGTSKLRRVGLGGCDGMPIVIEQVGL